MASQSIRDSQRQKIYNAEREAFDRGEDREPDFPSLGECQAYVDHVMASPTWKALGFSHLGIFKSHPLTVKDGRRRRRGAADSFGNRIKMPRWTRMDYYFLHELAHIATDYLHNFYYDDEDEDGGGWPGEENPKTGRIELERNVAAHGPEYAGIYLYLVRGLLGHEAAQKLLASFETHRVKHVLPELATPVAVPVDETPMETAAATVELSAEPAKPVQDETPLVTEGYQCVVCGSTISSTSPGSKRFCSDSCRNRFHSIRRSEDRQESREKICVECGREFTAKKSNARTCSRACRLRLHREQKRRQQEAAVTKDVSQRVVVGDRPREKPLTTQGATQEARTALARMREIDARTNTTDQTYTHLRDYIPEEIEGWKIELEDD